MMHFLTYLLPVVILAGLSAGWVGVQILAKRMGTKNHFDDAGSCGNGCNCGADFCDRKDA